MTAAAVTPALLIGVEETAALIGISRSTLHWWIQTNQAPPSGKFGGRRLFKRDTVLAWIDQQIEADSLARSA